MQLPLTEPQARDAALQQVEQAANGAWKAIAYSALQRLARMPAPFTADDLTDLMETLYVLPPATHDNRALGAILTQAKRKGLIRAVGYCRSQRPGNQAGPRNIWIGVGEGEGNGGR